MTNSLPKSPTKTLLPIVSSKNLSWKSIIVEEFQQPPGMIESGTNKQHTICLSLVSQPNRSWQTIGDRSFVGVYSK